MEPRIIEAFSSWLYFTRLQDETDLIESAAIPNVTNMVDLTCGSPPLSGMDLIKIWIFGDRILAPSLQNAALNALHRFLDIMPMSMDMICYVYEMQLPTSKLRLYMLDHFARSGEIKTFPRLEHEVVMSEFLYDLCRKLEQYRELQPFMVNSPRERAAWSSQDLCIYHVHHEEDCRGNTVTFSGAPHSQNDLHRPQYLTPGTATQLESKPGYSARN